MDEAIHLLEEALKVEPFHYAVTALLTRVLRQAREEDKALAILKNFEQANPERPDGHLLLGIHHHEMADYQSAREHYERALSLDPTNAVTLGKLGRLYNETREYDKARHYLEKAIESGQIIGEYAQYLALVYVTEGHLEQGWDLYSNQCTASIRLSLRWIDVDRDRTTNPLTGKRVLIRREQGLGDEIRWSGCYQDVINEADSCIIQCDERLSAIFKRSFPEVEVYPVEMANTATDIPPPEAYDMMCLAGDLPTRYRRRINDFDKSTSWLKSDPDKNMEWRNQLNALNGDIKVGLCWRTDVITWHRMRTGFYSHLDDWGDVLTIPGVSFVNLFYGQCDVELDRAKELYGVDVHVWPDLDLRDDLDDVFALISQLDLVISAQTAVMDMAGAIGTETWAAVHPVTYLGTDHIPWYRSVNPIEFNFGDTPEIVLSRIAERLRQRVRRI